MTMHVSVPQLPYRACSVANSALRGANGGSQSGIGREVTADHGLRRELGIEPRAVVHASSSGGTQAGLVAGFAALKNPVTVQGINVNDKDTGRIVAMVHGLCRETCEAIDIPVVEQTQIRMDHDYLGPDYGIPTDAMREAVKLAATREGILLDPVYTGKAMAGLIGLVRAGAYKRGETVLFLHTGGSAGLFAYRDALSN